MKEKIRYIKTKNPVELLISISVIIFLVSYLLFSFGLFRFSWIALPLDFDNFTAKPWTIITYAFFHSRFIALVFNMILLFYFGSILLDYTSKKVFLILFFTGVILGGVFFMYSYKFFPKMFVNRGALLGASAGIMAVLTYISIKMPHFQMRIRFLGNIKLMYILIFFIIFNLLQIPLGNPGGYFAPLGGLLTGFIFFIVEKYTFKRKEKTSFSVNINDENTGKNYKINLILEKINRSGYESLSDEEKEFLFRQGR